MSLRPRETLRPITTPSTAGLSQFRLRLPTDEQSKYASGSPFSPGLGGLLASYRIVFRMIWQSLRARQA